MTKITILIGIVNLMLVQHSRHIRFHIFVCTYSTCTELLISQVRKARQVWVEIDVDDFVAVGCKWAEVSDNL